MRKRFIICLIVLVVIFLSFVLLKETSKKYMVKNQESIKNYNFVK